MVNHAGVLAARVVTCSRKAGACEAARPEFQAAVHEILATPAHVGKAEDITRLVEATLERF